MAVLLPGTPRSLSCLGTEALGTRFRGKPFPAKVENCWKCLELGKYEQAQEAAFTEIMFWALDAESHFLVILINLLSSSYKWM